MNLLKENTGNQRSEGLENDFLHGTPFAQELTSTIDKRDVRKNPLYIQGNNRGNKHPHRIGKNVFSYTLDRGKYTEYRNNSKQMTQFKNGPWIRIDSF